MEKQATFFPGTKDYDLLKNRSVAEQIEALKFEFESSKNHMQKEISRCERLEKGLKILFGGYYAKEEQLNS